MDKVNDQQMFKDQHYFEYKKSIFSDHLYLNSAECNPQGRRRERRKLNGGQCRQTLTRNVFKRKTEQTKQGNEQ